MFIDPVDEMVTHLEQTLPIDTHRLYLTGASLGAFGTWAYALKDPERFAAIAPMSGGYLRQVKQVPPDICKLKPVALWDFHGAQDNLVPVWQSQIMVDALKACGGDVKFTLYPDLGHVDTWLRAYQDPALWDWFLAHSRQ
jgi:predicted peptidase